MFPFFPYYVIIDKDGVCQDENWMCVAVWPCTQRQRARP
jgi:hypothetical protein